MSEPVTHPTSASTPGNGRSDLNHLIRFGIVGIGSTVLYTVLFALLDAHLNHHIANVSALLFCTVVNTWVNQRFTFDAAGHDGAKSAHIQSIAIVLVTLLITTAALMLEHHLWPGASTFWDTVTVTIGNLIATIVRFVVLRKVFSA